MTNLFGVFLGQVYSNFVCLLFEIFGMIERVMWLVIRRDHQAPMWAKVESLDYHVSMLNFCGHGMEAQCLSRLILSHLWYHSFAIMFRSLCLQNICI